MVWLGFVNTVVLRADVSGIRRFGVGGAGSGDRSCRVLLMRMCCSSGWWRRSIRCGRWPITSSRSCSCCVTHPVRRFSCGLTVEDHQIGTRQAKYDLTFGLAESADGTGISGNLEYNADLFDQGTAHGLRSARRVADRRHRPTGPPRRGGGAADRTERTRLLQHGQGPPAPGQARVPAAFCVQVASTPDAPAVTCSGVALSCAELAAGQPVTIGSSGWSRPSHVAILQNRSVDLAVPILVLKAGGAAYVPRYRRPAGSSCLTTAERRAPHRPGQPSAGRAHPDHPLSSTTTPSRPVCRNQCPLWTFCRAARLRDVHVGIHRCPQGRGGPHTDVVSLATDRLRSHPRHRVLVHSPQAFDASTYEWWCRWLSGGTAVIAPPDDLDVATLARVIRQRTSPRG